MSRFEKKHETLLSGRQFAWRLVYFTGFAFLLIASAYAVFSGLVFIGVVGIMLTPIMHRILHRFHLEDDNAESQ